MPFSSCDFVSRKIPTTGPSASFVKLADLFLIFSFCTPYVVVFCLFMAFYRHFLLHVGFIIIASWLLAMHHVTKF